MEKRRLGRTEHMSTIVAFGGAAIGKVTQDVADVAMQNALDHGVNHFDVAPTYGDAELRLAPWMQQNPQRHLPRLQDDRADARGREAFDPRLARTARRGFLRPLPVPLGRHDGETRSVSGTGGAIEAVMEARDEGLFKYIGITGHGLDAPKVHAEGLRRFPFDTVMFPLNFVLYTNLPEYRRDYEALIALCQQQDVGVHIIKTLAKSPWYDREHPPTKPWYEPFDDQETIDRAVAFNAAEPIHTMCCLGRCHRHPEDAGRGGALPIRLRCCPRCPHCHRSRL